VTQWEKKKKGLLVGSIAVIMRKGGVVVPFAAGRAGGLLQEKKALSKEIEGKLAEKGRLLHTREGGKSLPDSIGRKKGPEIFLTRSRERKRR